MTAKTDKLVTIDPDKVDKHFDAAQAEKYWNKVWEEKGIYRYNSQKSREQTFVVDTPPPTVSGSLHIGHVFSYTHTDIIVRFQRMCGKNIFYPMGWDDNGLPTERRVQNYFHVNCNPELPYDPKLVCNRSTSKQRKKPSQSISRKNFIELCEQLTREDEQAFMNLWRRIGLSVDWQEEYATIDKHCRTLAQLSFIDLYGKGHIFNQEAPTMWDVDFQTAVAQAEVEDRSVNGAFYNIAFGVEKSDEEFIIATTRPELLPACVGVTAHPEDKRYKHLLGKKAVTPLFRVPVPIFASELADPEKGTGILMVCTFGDATDVFWWREQKLKLRQVLGMDGRFLPITFGSNNNWQSMDAGKANLYYEQLAGKGIKAAKRIIVELLNQPGAAATGNKIPLRGEPENITHDVKFYEKGENPLEFIPTRQWFVRLLDKKALLIKKADQIDWYPPYMKLRYQNWTENLQFDWCISRQRYFGVPFPVWYRLDTEGVPDYNKPLVPGKKQLPVDPMTDVPPGFSEKQRNIPGGFTGESDVFDTWFTSSLTPQIGSHWQLNPQRHKKLFPMDIRPQAHDIIRTWAFYTIAKAALHEDLVPWHNIVLSGFILDPDRKKMSKSKGNVVTPMEYMEKFTADGVRYWAGNARLGTDTAFDEKVLKVGKRLVTKLFNAGKFVLSQKGNKAPITCELDLAFIEKLRQLIIKVTQALQKFDFARALMETEDFFWHNFTDTYLELVKNRAKSATEKNDPASHSAVNCLRLGLKELLKLFAPTLPYITEEIWSWVFGKEGGAQSIHLAAWPEVEDFTHIPSPESSGCFDVAVNCLSEIHKYKTINGVSVGKEIEKITVTGHPDTNKILKIVIQDVMQAAHTREYQLLDNDQLEKNQFTVSHVVFL